MAPRKTTRQGPGRICEVCGKETRGRRQYAGHMWMAHRIRVGIIAELEETAGKALQQAQEALQRTEALHKETIAIANEALQQAKKALEEVKRLAPIVENLNRRSTLWDAYIYRGGVPRPR